MSFFIQAINKILNRTGLINEPHDMPLDTRPYEYLRTHDYPVIFWARLFGQFSVSLNESLLFSWYFPVFF